MKTSSKSKHLLTYLFYSKDRPKMPRAALCVKEDCRTKCGSQIICQPRDLRMVVISTIPDNALLHRLRV